MFKRSTKITALLVAAASIISTVPAMAATKLANKEGTVENAVAFKDGKYLYEGYRTDDYDKGLYYNAGDKDKKVDDADSLKSSDPFDLAGKYADKYVAAFDGSDDYVIDLSTGKISDDDTLGDLKDTAETKLQNKLKKTKRYDKGSNVTDAVITNKVDNGKFGDVWYEYQATTSGDANTIVTGYTNESGTYMDASYDMNLYVFDGSDMVKLEDVEDDANNATVKINKVTHLKTLGQDEKYIYRLIKVNATGVKSVKDNTVDVSDLYFVQKISKATGEKEKDAYLPKSTDCYQVAPEAVLNNGDVKNAYEVIRDRVYNMETASNVTGVAAGQVTFVDGNMYISYTDDDKVKVFKLVFKTSEKLKINDSKTNKADGRIVKKDSDTDTAIAEENDTISWSVDTNGTTWAIEGGKIKKSVKGGDFETVYTCDRSLDSIDVYDENSLIAWDKSGDVYTTVTEGSKQAQDEAEEIVGDNTSKDPVKTGWVQAADGTWTLIDVTGAKVTGWANVGGVWYYMDKSTTVMKTGWVNDGGTWYYCNASGAMQTGWLNDAGTWYYLQSNGAMKTGWLNDNGTWYYLNANGSMAANTTVDGYVLGANGAWIR